VEKKITVLHTLGHCREEDWVKSERKDCVSVGRRTGFSVGRRTGSKGRRTGG
jgi:hypothetical protein